MTSTRPETPIPSPWLTYPLWDLNPDMSEVAYFPGDPRLHSVVRATATLRASGALEVRLDGPMRKRDGGRGQHDRTSRIDTGKPQPAWVVALVEDARRRLAATGHR